MIRAVSASGYQPMNFYTFGANASLQESAPVTPVTPVAEISPLTDGLDRLSKVSSQPERSGEYEPLQMTNTDQILMDRYQQVAKADYNLTNPYEAARMSSESALLSGMNFNQMA